MQGRLTYRMVRPTHTDVRLPAGLQPASKAEGPALHLDCEMLFLLSPMPIDHSEVENPACTWPKARASSDHLTQQSHSVRNTSAFTGLCNDEWMEQSRVCV